MALNLVYKYNNNLRNICLLINIFDSSLCSCLFMRVAACGLLVIELVLLSEHCWFDLKSQQGTTEVGPRVGLNFPVNYCKR